MAGLIPQSFIDDLLDRVDIVDVVDSRVKLKKTGKNYSACCPFHDEKTPSFTVSPDKQFYYCFGCGASGTALSFVLEFDRLSFPDAVDTLARTVGLEVPREVKDDSPALQHRNNLFRILEQSNQHFQQQLRHSPARQHAVNYLQSRGLSGTIAKAFGIGYAPPGWDNLLKALGDSDSNTRLLHDAGLLVEREEDKRRYDRFRNRIMFPIRDIRGRVIGFGGRVLSPDDKPKYLNSPETPVFHKGRELYGLYEARQHYRELPRLLVVEGYMDVVALAQFGIHYAAATLGTACGEDHLKLAFKHTQEVVFCFDGDQAGRNAARRALENSLGAMQDGRQVKFLFLPDGEDPDSLVRQVGAEKFSRMVDLAVPLEDFLFDSVADGIDIRSMEGRARFSKRVAPLLHRLPQGVFRELMFASLAQRTGLSVDTLLELMTPEPEPAPRPAPAPTSAPATPRETTPRAAEPPMDEPPAPVQKSQRQLLPRAEPHRNTPPAPAHSTAIYAGSIKLPPAKFLLAMLLQHPELAARTPPELPNLLSSQDSDLQLFARLLTLLQQRPGYSLPRILGHWRGAHGEQAAQYLAELADMELINAARLRGPFNAEDEYLDTLHLLEQRLLRQQQDADIDALKRKHYSDLSDADKQRLREHFAKLAHSNQPRRPSQT